MWAACGDGWEAWPCPGARPWMRPAPSWLTTCGTGTRCPSMSGLEKRVMRGASALGHVRVVFLRRCCCARRSCRGAGPRGLMRPGADAAALQSPCCRSAACAGRASSRRAGGLCRAAPSGGARAVVVRSAAGALRCGRAVSMQRTKNALRTRYICVMSLRPFVVTPL